MAFTILGETIGNRISRYADGSRRSWTTSKSGPSDRQPFATTAIPSSVVTRCTLCTRFLGFSKTNITSALFFDFEWFFSNRCTRLFCFFFARRVLIQYGLRRNTPRDIFYGSNFRFALIVIHGPPLPPPRSAVSELAFSGTPRATSIMTL